MNNTPLSLKIYGDGIQDGFEIVLRLILGEEAAGGVPYSGPVPDELRHWAQSALDKIKTSA